jgi:hypothetical protein
MAGTATISWFSTGNPLGPVIFDFDAQVGDPGMTTHTLTGLPAGCLLIVATCNENSGQNCTVGDDQGLTWTKQIDVSQPNSEIHTAVFAAGGDIEVTSDWLSNYQSSVCYVITGQEAVLSGNEVSSPNDQNNISNDIVTTKANSLIICVTSEWGNVDGSGRVYLNGAIETQYSRNPAAAAFYHYYYQATSVTTYTTGLSTPTGGSVAGGTCVMEIRVA